MLKTNIFFGWWRLEGVCVGGGGGGGWRGVGLLIPFMKPDT